MRPPQHVVGLLGYLCAHFIHSTCDPTTACRRLAAPLPIQSPVLLLSSCFRPRPSAIQLFQAPKHCCIDLLSLFSELCPHTHHHSNSATAAVLADSVCPSSAHKQSLALNCLQNEVGFLSIALQTLAICRTLESAGPLLHPPKDAPPSHAWNNTSRRWFQSAPHKHMPPRLGVPPPCPSLSYEVLRSQV